MKITGGYDIYEDHLVEQLRGLTPEDRVEYLANEARATMANVLHGYTQANAVGGWIESLKRVADKMDVNLSRVGEEVYPA